MASELLDEQKLGEIVDAFIKSGDTAALNSLFDAYEPLVTDEKNSGLRLGEWNKLKADVRGLAVAILNNPRINTRVYDREYFDASDFDNEHSTRK